MESQHVQSTWDPVLKAQWNETTGIALESSKMEAEEEVSSEEEVVAVAAEKKAVQVEDDE